MTNEEALTKAMERAIALLTVPSPLKGPYSLTLEQREFMQASRAEMCGTIDKMRMLAMLCGDYVARIDQVLACEDDGA